MEQFLRSTSIKPTADDIALVDLQLPEAKPQDHENQDNDDSLAITNSITSSITSTVVDHHVGTSGEPDGQSVVASMIRYRRQKGRMAVSVCKTIHAYVDIVLAIDNTSQPEPLRSPAMHLSLSRLTSM
jgi:hypothetical protein